MTCEMVCGELCEETQKEIHQKDQYQNRCEGKHAETHEGK